MEVNAATGTNLCKALLTTLQTEHNNNNDRYALKSTENYSCKKDKDVLVTFVYTREKESEMERKKNWKIEKVIVNEVWTWTSFFPTFVYFVEQQWESRKYFGFITTAFVQFGMVTKWKSKIKS